jgi:preprotein translocase subunit SecG
MLYVFYSVHVLICLFLILVVLLQQGKGADLSVFGGGNTMTAFGARGAATLLHKLTVWGFIGFIVTTLSIGILKGHEEGSSVMSGEDASQEVPAADEGDAETEPQGALADPEGALGEADEPPAGALEEAGETGDEGSGDDDDDGSGDF